MVFGSNPLEQISKIMIKPLVCKTTVAVLLEKEVNHLY
jgi:hypothetical protein